MEKLLLEIVEQALLIKLQYYVIEFEKTKEELEKVRKQIKELKND